jgi:hypothetical protein
MSYSDYNKKRCKEYYYRTKDNLSDETKQKRREQARLRQRTFYLKNKELIKLRVNLCRIENKEKKEKIKIELEKLNNIITDKEIKIIKSMNLIDYIKQSPRLKMWNKKVSEWTFKDYNKLLSLT